MRARHRPAAAGVHAGNAATQQTRKQSTQQRRRRTTRARRSRERPHQGSRCYPRRRRSEAAASRRVRCSAAVKSVPATRPPSDALRVTRARRRRTKVTEIDQRNEGHHRNTHGPDERVQHVLHARVQRVQKQENSKRAPTTRAEKENSNKATNQTGKYRLNGKIQATFSGK